MRKPVIQKGDKYNRLTAIKFDHMGKNSQQYWLFRCSCGNKKIIRVSSVKSFETKSCGCLKKELSSKRTIKRNTTHGMTETREYNSWQSMKQRCYNKNAEHYKWYGSRGITVCKHWLGKNGFKNFYKDMGERPKEMSLDRVDNLKGYNKDNCRWATATEQSNNKRNNHLLTYNEETKTISQWSKKIGIKNSLLSTRIRRGWSIEKALKIT